MGNKPNSNKDAYGMNVQLIGKYLTNYKDIISKGQSKNSIQNFWKFEYNSYLDVNSQINRYFYVKLYVRDYKPIPKDFICVYF